ncbi:3-isopropylmalate dehydratase large subunit [Colwellia sp. MEBiC06753]
MNAQTLYDKLWALHQVEADADPISPTLLYIDRHLVHEVTSAQAFEGLKLANRQLWRKQSILATPDHQVPTTDRAQGLAGFTDDIALLQVKTLNDNCQQHDIKQFDINDQRQGIVHIVGPEQGAILPGMTVVCGDSHTSTHGAFACLAQGIGTSEVEHVLATQCLEQAKSKNLRVTINGRLPFGTTAKDLILYVIGQLGSAGGTGYAIEYAGEAIEQLSMEGRMTVCNMTIEAGARSGLIAYDQITEDYLKDKPYAPKGQQWQQAISFWRTLTSDTCAHFDKELVLDASDIKPQVTWGTKPDQVVAIDQTVPLLSQARSETERTDWQKALAYMGLSSGQKLSELIIDQVFIGSCTNGRIEDIRQVANLVKGKKLAPNIKRAMVVPGSGLIKAQAEQEGLAKIITDAGFEWRYAGCSMCNAMNPDVLASGERCASTSNRNFEGRQGQGGRTHLVSPEMAAAAAIAGHFVDVTTLGVEDAAIC